MRKGLKCWIALGMLVWTGSVSKVFGRSPGEVRELLDALLDTQYCGTAMLELGIGADTAIHGISPISGNRVFDVPEREWLPVLKDMTEEEIVSLNGRLADTIDEMHRLEAAGKRLDNTGDEGTLRLWELQKQVWHERARLESMATHLRYATIETNGVLDLLMRVETGCPRECGLYVMVNMSMVEKACRDGQIWRCAELGRWYRGNFGNDGQEEANLFSCFARHGLPELQSEADRREGLRYLCEYADSLREPQRAFWFDRMGKEMLPGWEGSLQRRQLAERCLASDETRGAEETSSERVQRVCPWAAAELAAAEAELVDLREVYGDWREGDGDE